MKFVSRLVAVGLLGLGLLQRLDSPAWAQQYQPQVSRVVSTGDAWPGTGGGTITSVDSVAVDDSGGVYVAVRRVTSSTAYAIARADGPALLASGDSVQLQVISGGTVVTSTSAINAMGALDAAASGSAVWSGRILSSSGQFDSAGRDGWALVSKNGPTLTDNTKTYFGPPFVASAGLSGGGTSFLAVVSSVGSSSAQQIELAQFGSSGFVLSSPAPILVAQTGSPAPQFPLPVPPAPPATFGGFKSTSPTLSTSINGRTIFVSSVAVSPTQARDAIYEYDPSVGQPVLLAYEGGPALGTAMWGNLGLARVDINSSGTWAAVAEWTNAPSGDRLTRGLSGQNAGTIAMVGDPAPGFPSSAGWTLHAIGTSRVFVGDDDSIVVPIAVQDTTGNSAQAIYAAPSSSTALQALVKTGDSVPGGTLGNMNDTPTLFHVSDSGRFVAFVAAVGGRTSVFLMDLSSASTPFCFGDGSGTPCPCSNASPSGDQTGCLNSTGLAGSLRSTGVASISNDTLNLCGSQMPGTVSALYFQGTTQAGSGAGTVFGDGLRCAGGSVIRLGTSTTAQGTSAYPQFGDTPIATKGVVSTAGTRTYQCWYRNAASFCTVSTFNLTNGVSVSWAP